MTSSLRMSIWTLFLMSVVLLIWVAMVGAFAYLAVHKVSARR
jgi:hypothetical protein